MPLPCKDVEQSFQNSLQKFQTRLSARERDMFKVATLNDLCQTILRIQAEQAAKSKAMNLARLKRFLEGVDQFGKLIEVLLNNSQFVAFVWGPMKFILQIASNYADAFDVLLTTYEEIGESIPLLEQYRTLFPDNSHMQLALANIYEDILEFHRRALRLFTLPTWQQLFRSVWRDFNSRFGHIIQDLRQHKALIESQATYLQFEQYQADRLRVLDRFDRDEKMERKQTYAYILQWASPADSLVDHEDICSERREYSITGAWLLRNTIYRSWREDSVPKSSILWLNGILGAGKTFLASMIIDDCKRDPNAQAAFIYCKHNDSQRTTCAALLRTLLCQLLRYDHDLLPWLHDQCITSGLSTLTSVEYCKRFLKMVILDADKVYLIIDGLDECERSHRKEFLNIVNDLVDACDTQNPGKLRIMLVSQDEPDIRKAITVCTEKRLKPADNEQDIEMFVRAWCKRIQDKFDDITDEDADLICKLTCERADGMFLFARLVMNNLYEQNSLEKLVEQIQPSVFPKGLDQAYDRILNRMDNRSQNEQSAAKTILGWMICAKRPLKWHEIQAIASIDLNKNEVNFTAKKMRVHIRDICGSLVTQLSGDRIELVHSSAKHYLTKSKYLQPLSVECRLAALCIRYLTFECFDNDLSPDERHEYLIQGYYTFQDYAVAHWGDHLVQVTKIGADVSLSDASEITSLLGSALTDFVAQYGLSETENTALSKAGMDCEHFKDADFFDDMTLALAHIQQQRSNGIKALEEIGLKPLEKVFSAIRSLLESLPLSKTSALETEESLKTLYGQNWFKCPRVTCYYFYEGFAESKSRQSHELRHEKPFRCPLQDCETGYKLGFTSKKDLDKHALLYHPELDQAMQRFSRLKKSSEKTSSASSDLHKKKETKHPAKWACPNCPKTFTRRAILHSHLNTHGDSSRPFTCTICGKTFMRDNDRKRHETGHSGENKLTCTVKCGLPVKEHGCGRVFLRRDMLARHWKSTGKKCLAPLLEEQKIHQDWAARLEKTRVDGSMLPIPRPLLEQYPDLTLANWHDIIKAQTNSNDADKDEEMTNSSSEDRNGIAVKSRADEAMEILGKVVVPDPVAYHVGNVYRNMEEPGLW